ncbi:MAG: hypothetical protein HC915_11575 [Anaerolineae bacterium]|nr:hypothetical protein [Anaerolineae bacterium]
MSLAALTSTTPRILLISPPSADPRLTQRIRNHLRQAFGAGNVMTYDPDLDEDSARDPLELLRHDFQSYNIALVLVDQRWPRAAWLDDPEHPVHEDIAQVMKIPTVEVIPLLVMPASLPPAQALPADLQALSALPSFSMRPDTHFEADMNSLISSLSGQRRLGIRGLLCGAIFALSVATFGLLALVALLLGPLW